MKARTWIQSITCGVWTLLLATACDALGPKTVPFDPAQMYAVYATLLESGDEPVLVIKEVSEFSLSDELVPGWGWERPKEIQKVWEAVQFSEEHPSQLEGHFGLQPGRIQLIDDQDLERIWEKDWSERCKAFSDTYPGVRDYTRFSKIAFNSGMNKAMLTRSSRDCLGCGFMSLLYLAKVGGEWVVRDSARLFSFGC